MFTMTSDVRCTLVHSETILEGSNVMQTGLAGTIADQIRAMIRDERMMAGQKLPTESELISRFNVGRSTIREAMKRLQAENIVEIRHGTGSFVAQRTGIVRDPFGLDFEEQGQLAGDLMEVRLMLEPQVAASAARRHTPRDIEAMRAANHGMKRAAAAGESTVRWDSEFHIAVANAAGNIVLRRMYPTLFEAAMEASYRSTVHVSGSIEAALSYHDGILQAIEAGDGPEAARLSELHIRQTTTDINDRQRGEPT